MIIGSLAHKHPDHPSNIQSSSPLGRMEDHLVLDGDGCSMIWSPMKIKARSRTIINQLHGNVLKSDLIHARQESGHIPTLSPVSRSLRERTRRLKSSKSNCAHRQLCHQAPPTHQATTTTALPHSRTTSNPARTETLLSPTSPAPEITPSPSAASDAADFISPLALRCLPRT